MQIASGWMGVALGLSAYGGLALGGSWTEVDAGLPRSPARVRTVVIDPSSPSAIYALEFSAPPGWGHGSLFKSKDGGGTWNLAGGLSSVTALAIDPRDSSKLYAIAHGSVLKSTDGGQSWTITGLGLNSATTLAIDPHNTSTLYAIAGRAIFKTTDEGASWSRKTTGLPASWPSDGYLTIAATEKFMRRPDRRDPSTIFVNVGDGLYKSTDGGESWRGLTVGQGSWTIGPEALDPVHPSTVYTVVLDRTPQPWQDEDLYFSTLFKSTDGGETWSGTTPLPGTVTSLAVDLTSTIYALNIPGAPYGNGVVVKSTDGGASWSPIKTPLLDTYSSLALNPTNPSAIFAVTERGGVFRTLDGGANWTDASADLAITDVHALAIDPMNRGAVYAGARDGVSESIDSGADWSTVHFAWPAIGPAPGVAFVPSLLIDPHDPRVLYGSVEGVDGCLSSSRLLRKSTDGGATWSDLPGSTYCAFGGVSLAMDPGDSNTLYAAPQDPIYFGTTTLFKTSDGGASWNLTHLDGFVIALAIDPSNPATLYGGRARSGGVIKSADGGKSWAGTALTNVDVDVLALDPTNSNILYAGTLVPYPDGTPGMFKTTDGGATWSPTNKGLEGIIATRTPITSLVLDPKLSVLYLGTSGGGVFKSVDGGANWTPFNDGLPSLDIRALAVNSDGSGTVYAGTPGGVFRAVDKQ